MKNYLIIWLGLLLSSIVIFCKYFFQKTPELFPGGAFILDVLLFNFSLSFVAGSIFYFVTVFLPRRRDQQNIYESMRLNLNGIVGGTKSVFNGLFQNAGEEKDFYKITQQDLKEICPKIKLKGKSPPIVGYITYTEVNWAQFLLYYKDRQFKTIEKLFIYTPFLDGELVKFLSEIINSNYYTLCEEVVRNYQMYTQPDLTSFSNDLYDFYLKVRQLEKYCKAKKIMCITI